MSVEIVPSNVEFFRQLINDEDYTDNPSETTPELVGNGMLRTKMTQTIDIEWFLKATNSNSVFIHSMPDYAELSAGSWKDVGNGSWSIGDTWDFIQGGSVLAQGEILSFSADGKRMYMNKTSGTFSQDTYKNNELFRGTTPVTAMFWNFGIIENNEDVLSYQNAVTEGDQSYYLGGITGGLTDMVSLGARKDWVTGSMKVSKSANPYTYVQRFNIEHEFRLPEFATEETIQNLINNVPPDIYNGTNSGKYIFSINVQTSTSGINSKKSAEFDINLGWTGWYDENFNGLNNDYAVDSVVYTDTATGLETFTGFKLGTRTTATITISTTRANAFATDERVGLLISYLPPSDEFINTTTDFDENFIIDQSYNEVDAVSSPSDFIKEYSIVIDTGKLVITAEIEYSDAQRLRLDDSKYFVIGIDVADPSFSSGNSDQVLLKADVQQYVTASDIPDLITNLSMNFFDEMNVVGVDTGSTDFIAWNEEGFTVSGDLDLDLDKEAVLETLQFGMLGYDSTTGDTFILDSVDIDLSGVVVNAGTQEIEIDTNRGYNLATGSQFDKVFLTTGALAAGKQTYSFIIGQKVPWQEWRENLNVPTLFYDALEPNNNRNFKTSNYAGVNGYTVHFYLHATLTGIDDIGQSGISENFELSPAITVNDYLIDGGTPTYTPIIKTFNNDTLSDLGGAIIGGTDTLVKARYTYSALPDITGVFGWNRIEISNGGFNNDELSSINLPPITNLLKPITGETLSKIYIDAGDVVVECLIDGSLIDESLTYNLSSEIKEVDMCNFITEDGINFLTEDGDSLIPEDC